MERSVLELETEAAPQEVEPLAAETSEAPPRTLPRTPVFAHLAGPLWARGLQATEDLVPTKSADATRITFYGPSDSTPAPARAAEAREVLTRSLPLYLAETLHCCTTAQATCAMPVAAGDFSPVPAGALNFATMLQACPLGEAPDVLIGCHVQRGFFGRYVVLEPWLVEDEAMLGTLSVKVTGNFQEMALKLVSLLAKRLRKAGLAREESKPGVFAPPPLSAGDDYLLALHGLSRQILAGEGLLEAQGDLLERDSFQRYLDLAECMPETMAPRLMTVAAALAGLKSGGETRYRSELERMLFDSGGNTSDIHSIAPELAQLLKR